MASSPHFLKNQQSALPALLFAVGLSNFDRFAVGPIIVLLGNNFGMPVSKVSGIITAYFISYGLGQLVWGVLSDRFGRIIIVRIALTGAAIGSIASALSPSLDFLLMARLITGAFCGALIPATITYIGDTISIESRQKSLANMLAAMATGRALATCLSGFLADYGSWRIVLAITAGACFIILIMSRQIENIAPANKTSPFITLLLVFRSRWACFLMAIAVIEGALVLGIFSLLPTAMQQQGLGSGAAGCVAALYGVSVLIVSRFVKILAVRPLLPMLIGGACLVFSYVLPACLPGIFTLGCTAVLLGATWALFHSSLQTWMTTTVPAARATAVAAMTTALFLGSGLGTSLAAPLIEAHNLGPLFESAAIISIILVLAAIVARSRYKVSEL